jgi:beta-glucanase (GH16 family)
MVGITSSSAASAPIVSSIAPSVIAQGATGVVATVTGNGFQSGATVTIGHGVTASAPTLVGTTQVKVKLAALVSAVLDIIDVTVKNPDGGTGVCHDCLRISAGPKISTTAVGTSTASPSPASPGLWTSTFADEFSGTTLDPSKWATKSFAESDGQQGNAGNKQLEWNQPQNCSVANGTLTITAKPDNITSPSGHHYDWSSCLVTSTPSYSFQYGFMEERAQLPSLGGMWAALWTWQIPGLAKHIETDAFEFYSNNHNNLDLTQHTKTFGVCHYAPPFDPTTGFHTYGVDIEPTGTTWYVDGTSICTVPGTSTGLANIIADLFVSADRPPVAGTVEHKHIDYIRAWTRVTPALSKAAPATTVTLTGFSFASGATVTIAGVTVTQPTLISSKEFRFTAKPNAGAAIGPRTITMKNPDGGRFVCSGCVKVTA